MQEEFYNISDECSKCCNMLEYLIGNQTKDAFFIVSCFIEVMK